MTETDSSAEIPHYSREQIVGMFEPLTKLGVGDPALLPNDDPAVQEAEAAFTNWNNRGIAQAEQNPSPGALLEHSLLSMTLHYDAGFIDPDYLNEVANDWLNNDQAEAEHLGLTELAARIQAKRDEINARLAN